MTITSTGTSAGGETTVVVTGAGGGIGAAVARRLTTGHRLVVTDSSGDAVAALVAELGDLDGAGVVDSVVADLRRDDDLRRVVDLAASTGQVIGLVNVAGIGPVQTGDAFQILDVNLRATVRMIDAVRPHLISRSAVVSIGSVASARSPLDADELLLDVIDPDWEMQWRRRDIDPWAAYAYSKRGLALCSRRRAVDWARQGVRINIVSPSQTATPLGIASIAENPSIAAFVERIPMGRMAEPSEVADAVAFLLGSTASFITGTELLVDGGASAAGASLVLQDTKTERREA